MITMYMFLDKLERVQITNEKPPKEYNLSQVGRYFNIFECQGKDKLLYFKNIDDLGELYKFFNKKMDQKALRIEYNKENNSYSVAKMKTILNSLWNYKHGGN